MPTLYHCHDLTDKGLYSGSNHPEEKACYLCAECLAEAEGLVRVVGPLAPSDNHRDAFCWVCATRQTDSESPLSAFYAKWLDGDLESRYEDAQNGGLDID